MIEGLNILKNMTIEDVTAYLDSLIDEKKEALNTVNIAVNELVRLKNEYALKSNEWLIKPEEIKEELGLSRVPTEKQVKAFIDDRFSDLVQDLNIAEENVKSWKREVDLLDDKISAEKYRVRMLMGVIDDIRVMEKAV